MSSDYKINRQKFYKQASNDLKDVNLTKMFYLVEKAIKTNNGNLISYENIISLGKNDDDQKIDKKAYLELLFNVYKIWWNNWLEPKRNVDNNSYIGEKIQSILNASDINPNTNQQYVKKEIFDIMYYVDPEKFFNNAWYFQNSNFVLFNTRDFFADKGKKLDCDARLYLNIKPQNAVKLATILIDDAIKNDIPLLFKFALKNKRNDSFVFYVKFEEIDEIVNLIEKTKKSYPELFVGCKVTNPLMATYKKYMGFGEEPLGFGSYTSNRVEVFEFMYSKLSKEYATNTKSLTKKNMEKYFLEGCKYNCIDPIEFYKNADLEKIFENFHGKNDSEYKTL